MSVAWGPSLSLKWGEYQRADAADKLADVNVVKTARDAGLITRRTAVESLRLAFGIENVDEYLEALEAEDEDRENEEIEALRRAAGESHAKAAADAGSADDARVAHEAGEGETPDDADKGKPDAE